ncbi:MAG: hypothetical protein V1933_08305 [Candidatus Omnitrophota bacterium]
MDIAANDGRMFAITLDRVGKLQQVGNEALADLLISNLIHLRSPPATRQKLLRYLQDVSFREKLFKGFMLMSDSIKGKPLPQDKPIRLCVVIEDKNLPTMVFKDPCTNPIAHSGKGEKTSTPYTSIYAGYNSLEVAFKTDREDDFKKIINHEANDIARGYHLDEETKEAANLYDTTLDLYDAGMFKFLWFDILNKSLEEGNVYKIKYDAARLSESQIAIIKEYVRLLSDKTKSKFEAIGFSSARNSKETLITVYREDRGGNVKGKGFVDIDISKGAKIEEYALRITGMVNIALAASNIDGETNSPLVGFIRAQCRLMVEDSVAIPEGFENLIKFIRNLPLPKASRMPTEKIVEYNERAKEALTAA